MNKESLTRQFDYHYWAARRLWRSVMILSDEQFTRIPSAGRPSIHTQIVRLVANENLWVDYLWHGEVEFLREAHLPTRASIRVEWDALEEEIRDFIDELSPDELECQVEPPFLSPAISFKVGETLLQIVNDAIECRAQLCLHLHHLNIPTLTQGFSDFLAEQGQRTMARETLALPAWMPRSLMK
jgi:uncharacterized damage-inducible protein DinB